MKTHFRCSSSMPSLGCAINSELGNLGERFGKKECKNKSIDNQTIISTTMSHVPYGFREGLHSFHCFSIQKNPHMADKGGHIIIFPKLERTVIAISTFAIDPNQIDGSLGQVQKANVGRAGGDTRRSRRFSVHGTGRKKGAERIRRPGKSDGRLS